MRSAGRSARRRRFPPRWGGGLLALAALLAGCGGGERRAPGGRDLDTVDVTAAPDATASTAGDTVEVRRAEPAVAGRLPTGFPPDVPLPEGGGIVDFGPAPAGAWVELIVPRPAAEAERLYRAQLARAGFRAEPDGVHARGTLRLAVTVTARGAGASVRLEPLAR